MKTLKELAYEIKAQFDGEDSTFNGFSIDTRTINQGEMFAAIKGEKVDGHDFIDVAEKNGATSLLVNKKIDSNLSQIIVPDVRLALGEISSIWRAQFLMPVIAITGSCGKTTTKEMLGSILNLKAKTLVTQGNLNNDYGVPLTLSKLNKNHQYAVIEAGSNHLGEIPYLANIIKPDISIITNVQAAHLEGFGSLDKTMIEKGALFDCLAENQLAVINLDDQRIKAFSEKLKCKKIYFSMINKKADIYLANEPKIINQQLCFDVSVNNKELPIKLNLWGKHQIANALAVIAVCDYLSIEHQLIQKGLENLKPVKGRFVPIEYTKNIYLIDDTYNASVPAMKASIETVAELKGKRICALGHMGELGDKQYDYHYEIGKHLTEQKLDEVYLYGNYDLLKEIIKAYPRARYFENQRDLVNHLKTYFDQNQSDKIFVLLKGSRATEMEHVIEGLFS